MLQPAISAAKLAISCVPAAKRNPLCGFPFSSGFIEALTHGLSADGLYLISKGCEQLEKSLEQLKQEYEKTTVLLERKRKMQRLKNRQAYLESGSRKQRTHRLITRGAAVESIAPQIKELTETEFISMESILQPAAGEHFIRSAADTMPVFPGQEKGGD